MTSRANLPLSRFCVIDLTRVRAGPTAVRQLADWGADPQPAEIRREIPAGSNRLPTAALGSTGGGPFAVDPRDDQGVTSLGRVFQLELALGSEVRSSYLGGRVFVRFDHGFEPVGFQIYRALRQLLLRRFNV